MQSALESAGVNVNMISQILAHKVKGIDFSYSEHNYQELLIKFKTALPYLLPQSVESVKVELEATKSGYETKITNQRVEIIKLSDALKTIEKSRTAEIEELKTEMKNIQRNLWFMYGGSSRDAKKLVNDLKVG